MNVLKDKVLLQLFNKSNFKKWDRNVSRAKFFLFIVKFKKLGLSVPLSALPKDTTSELAGLSPH